MQDVLLYNTVAFEIRDDPTRQGADQEPIICFALLERMSRAKAQGPGSSYAVTRCICASIDAYSIDAC